MPSASPAKRVPLAFSIRITPQDRGFSVETTPDHPVIRETVEDVVRGRVAIVVDRSTTISANASGTPKPWASERIGPHYVRRGLLQLAQVGAKDLFEANAVVDGYLYDASVSAVLGSMQDGNVARDGAVVVTIDPSVIPQLRVATYHWWRDMRQVIVSNEDGSLIRLCGVHHAEPFATWANARILARFRRRLAAHLGVPVSTVPAFSGLRAV